MPDFKFSSLLKRKKPIVESKSEPESEPKPKVIVEEVDSQIEKKELGEYLKDIKALHKDLDTVFDKLSTKDKELKTSNEEIKNRDELLSACKKDNERLKEQLKKLNTDLNVYIDRDVRETLKKEADNRRQLIKDF